MNKHVRRTFECFEIYTGFCLINFTKKLLLFEFYFILFKCNGIMFHLIFGHQNTDESKNRKINWDRFIFIFQKTNDDSSTCVWYGVCHVNPSTKHKLYCSNNTKALPLEPKGQKLLSTYCPHLLNGRDNTYTCCNTEQVIDVLKQFGILSAQSK